MNIQWPQILIGALVTLLLVIAVNTWQHGQTAGSNSVSSSQSDAKRWFSAHNDVHEQLHTKVYQIDQRLSSIETQQAEEAGDTAPSEPATPPGRRVRSLQPNRSVVVQNCPEPAAPPSGDAAGSAGAIDEPDDSARLATNVRIQCELPQAVTRFMEFSTTTLGQIDSKQDEVLTKQDQVLRHLEAAEQRILAAIRSQQEPPPEPE